MLILRRIPWALLCWDRHFRRSAKSSSFAGRGLCRPAVLNHSPIRAPNTGLFVGFGHIVAFGSRLPILLKSAARTCRAR